MGPEALRKLYDSNGLKCCGMHLATGALIGDNLKRTVELNQALGNRFLIVAADSARMASIEGIEELAGILNAAADALAQKFNARIVFTGTARDAGAIDGIIARSRCKPINLAGKTTVMELAALVRCCSVFISVDSAALHIAAAVGTPCVALFGPTDPQRHMPQAEHCVLVKKNVSCAPCYRGECARPKCMTGITADDVVDAVERIMPKKGTRTVYEGITDNHAS